MVRKRPRTRPSAGNCGELLRRILGKDESDRRIVILRALWQLMLKKGYASTSLTDVARKARLSLSHLAYYFPTKEAVLVELFAALSDALLSDLTNQRDEPPIQQCERLAHYAFREPKLDLGESAIALEMIGIALHNPRFRRRYSEYARKVNGYLRELFAQTPRAFNLSAEDAAVLATSMWIGLLTNSYFYKGFDRSRARLIFHQILLMLAGLNGQQFSLFNGRQAVSRPNGRAVRAANAPTAV
jgi:AcrR family transcriptional regulator